VENVNQKPIQPSPGASTVQEGFAHTLHHDLSAPSYQQEFEVRGAEGGSSDAHPQRADAGVMRTLLEHIEE